MVSTTTQAQSEAQSTQGMQKIITSLEAERDAILAKAQAEAQNLQAAINTLSQGESSGISQAADSGNGAAQVESSSPIANFGEVSTKLNGSGSQSGTGFVFPPSKFIEGTVSEAIIKYLLGRRTPANFGEIFSRFYKTSVKEWAESTIKEVKENLQRVLDEGVEEGLWQTKDKKYSPIESQEKQAS